jgi:hypothetical protein
MPRQIPNVGRTGLRFFDERFSQPELIQIPHAVAECSHTRQYQFCGRADIGRI